MHDAFVIFFQRVAEDVDPYGGAKRVAEDVDPYGGLNGSPGTSTPTGV